MIGELAALGCAAVWACTTMMLRVLTEQLSPVVVNAIRCAFGAITLAVLVLMLGQADSLASLPVAGVAAVVTSGVVSQGLGDLAFVQSVKMIGASRALPISGTSPLLTLGLAILFLGEKATWLGAAGTLMVIGGVTMLAIPRGSIAGTGRSPASDRAGVAMSLLAACLYAVGAVVLKSGLAGVALVPANLIRMAVATTLLFGIEISQTHRPLPQGITRRSLLILGVTGFFSAFSSLMYITALYYAGAARATVLSSTTPLFGLPLSLLFLRERINRRTVAGTLLSVAGIWLVVTG